MTESDLLQALARGEDSRQQFKRDATNADGMAAELAALANSGGGTVFLGVSNRRNAVLAEHAAHILPYRGMGTGVPRALVAWPQIDLVDEPDINQFRAVVWRTKVAAEVSDPGTGQVTPQVTPQVEAMLMLMTGEHARQELMGLLNLSDRKHFAQTYLLPALDAELLEMTIPDKPQSSKQKYRLTPAGKMLMTSLHKDKP